MSRYATLIGYLSLIFWAMAVVPVAKLKVIPTFEILSIAFATSFLMTIVLLTVKKRWHRIKQPISLWIVTILGIYGNDALYVAAFKHAPSTQVDLINYLWPVLVIVCSGISSQETFKLKYLIGCIVAFLGVYCLLTHNTASHGFQNRYWFGYLLALLDAIIWSAYTLVARYHRIYPVENIGICCGISMVLSFITHVCFEPFVKPSVGQSATMILMGLTTQGLAYYCWDIGVKKGNYRLLSILSYGNPILSINFLVMFGVVVPSMTLYFSASLVAFGGLIGSIAWPFLD